MNGINKEAERKRLLLLLFTGILFSVSWILTTDNGFLFDDYSNILMAKNQSYAEIFTFFPVQRYNDRCLAVMFVKLLYDIFGLNIQAYHFAFVGIHYVNVIIVYKILREYVLKEGPSKEYSAIIGAGIFGIYPISLMAVSWVSAEYEMVCSFFYVLCMYFYLKYKHNDKYNNFYGALCILCFYCALRSKEMAIVLPVLGILYELKESIENKKIKFSNVLKIALVIMLIFAGILFSKKEVSDLPTDSPYYQDYSLGAMITSAIRYLFLYFDLENSAFAYDGVNIWGCMGAVLVVLLVVYGIVVLVRYKQMGVICGILMIGVSLAPVLQLVNMQHRLYLYIPSIFIGITIAVWLQEFFEGRLKKHANVITVGIILGLVLVNYAPGVVTLKSTWITYCDEDKESIKSLMKQETLPVECKVYVKGASEGYNIFSYGPGNSVKLFQDNPTIEVELVDEFPKNVENPYVFWEFENGRIVEVKRDAAPPKINVTGVYPQEVIVDDEKEYTDISITCENIDQNMVICIDGVEYDTVVGEEFISTSVSNDYIKEVNEIKVKVINSYNAGESDTYTVGIVKER